MRTDVALAEIERMSVPEKLALIERLWASLPDAAGPDDVPASHLVELERRVTKADANPVEGKP